MNVSRDTTIAFALNEVSARKAMQAGIHCRYEDNSIYATTRFGSEFRILAVTRGEVHMPMYHRIVPPSIYWSTL